MSYFKICACFKDDRLYNLKQKLALFNKSKFDNKIILDEIGSNGCIFPFIFT